MKKLIFSILVIIVIFGCKTMVKQELEEDLEFETYVIKAQSETNKERYLKAIDILEKAQEEFPGKDVFTIKYLIGYNYYKAGNKKKAETFFKSVVAMFESKEMSEQEKLANKKFVVLSEHFIEEINTKEVFDPYHFREELKENKKIRPRKEK